MAVKLDYMWEYGDGNSRFRCICFDSNGFQTKLLHLSGAGVGGACGIELMYHDLFAVRGKLVEQAIGADIVRTVSDRITLPNNS